MTVTSALIGRLHRAALVITCLASLLASGLGSAAAPRVASADEGAAPEAAPAAEAPPVAETPVETPVVAAPAPAPAAAPAAPLSEAELAASLGMSALELQALNLINLDRLARGVHPLTWDPKLADVARAHAAEMMATGRVTHDGVDGSKPYDRIRAGADRVTWAGENIWTYRGRIPENGPPTMHGAMMAEPLEPGNWNHIANILLTTYHRVGIGIVVAPNGTQYLTEDFAD